jgi:hypothetical protein
MDSTAFRDAITSVGADASKFTNRIESLGGDAVEAMGTGLNSRRGKLTNTLNQLAFGFEDFASQLSTGGVGAGIRGAANNASQIAAAFGPVALLTTVIGTTLASLIVPKMVEWLSLSGDVAKKMEEIGQRQKDAIQRTEDIFRAEQKFSALSGPEQRDKTKKGLEEEIKLRETQLQQVAKIREDLLKIASEQQEANKELAKAQMSLGRQLTSEEARQVVPGLDAIRERFRQAFPTGGRNDRLDQLNEQAEALRKQLEAAYLQLQVFERVSGKAGAFVSQNLSPISSDLSGTQSAFSSILRSVTQSNMEKTDQQIEANTKQTAQAVIDMNNREKDSLASTSSTNRIVITTIGEVV